MSGPNLDDMHIVLIEDDWSVTCTPHGEIAPPQVTHLAAFRAALEHDMEHGGQRDTAEQSQGQGS